MTPTPHLPNKREKVHDNWLKCTCGEPQTKGVIHLEASPCQVKFLEHTHPTRNFVDDCPACYPVKTTSPTFRICTVCRKKFILNSDNFHACKVYGFRGFVYRCKNCVRLLDRTRGTSKLEYRKKHSPEKLKARSLLQLAAKTGKVIRGKCVECGEKKTHGHHPDYSKPLDVIWLCQPHHQALHNRIAKDKKL